MADDRTHRDTWDLLCKLVGRSDFLYVADCKLASTENMAYVHGHGGRFLTVLPRTRSEDRLFREALGPRPRSGGGGFTTSTTRRGNSSIATASASRRRRVPKGIGWCGITARARRSWTPWPGRGNWSGPGRIWPSSSRSSTSPRTRYRQRAKVTEAVEAILQARGTTAWVVVAIDEHEQEIFRQERPGRPNTETKYRREVKTRYELRYELNQAALAAEAVSDGVFPLITNDRELSEQALLLAYKGQPVIERRFAQLKTEFAVAPVYLKEVTRIQALLCLYFLVLLVQALLERELRRAMARRGVESLPMYPEGRACRCPTTPRLIELFENVQRHRLIVGKRAAGGHDDQAEPAATSNPERCSACGWSTTTDLSAACGNSEKILSRPAESRLYGK